MIYPSFPRLLFSARPQNLDWTQRETPPDR